MTTTNAPDVGINIDALIGSVAVDGCMSGPVADTIRAHLSRLEEQLAQARGEVQRIALEALAADSQAREAYAEVERLRADAAMLADDFQGCGDHSRHKQAAEAWHYCAKKIRAALATQTGEKGNG